MSILMIKYFSEEYNKALQFVLDAHREWIETEGRQGMRLDLAGRDLTGADFSVAKLHNANFDYADFAGCDLHRAKGVNEPVPIVASNISYLDKERDRLARNHDQLDR